MRRLVIATTLCLAAATTAAAQDFNWRGRIAAGKRLEVKGVNGDVRAVLASGAEAVVNANKHSRRSDPEDVKIEVVETADGITRARRSAAPAGHDRRRRAGADVEYGEWGDPARERHVSIGIR